MKEQRVSGLSRETTRIKEGGDDDVEAPFPEKIRPSVSKHSVNTWLILISVRSLASLFCIPP